MNERNTEHHDGVILDRTTTFTLTEFCRVCGAEKSVVIEMVEEGLIEPISRSAEWRFHGESLVRAHRALRLVNDLRLNLPGAALALDLLDEIDLLRTQRKGS